MEIEELNRKQLPIWKRAVVHLEVATHSKGADEIDAETKAITDRLRRGEISIEDVKSEWWSIERPYADVRSRGTAVFLEHQSKRFLVTARHLLHNQAEAKRIMQKWDALGDRGILWMQPDGTGKLKPAWDKQWRETDQAEAHNSVYQLIFRVASLDEGLQGKRMPQCLYNLGIGVPGTPWAVPFRDYTFSSPELDLAVISLNHEGDPKCFGEELLAKGYRPITLNHIDYDDEPGIEGDAVFTVGFPGRFSAVGQKPQHWVTSFNSAVVSLPVFSFGRVAMLHHLLPEFWCDMSIAPGNSGGPVVKGGNLVGIVTGQAIELAEDATPEEAKTMEKPPSLSYRLPFAAATKGRFVRELVMKQIEKLEKWDEEIARRGQAPPPPAETQRASS